MQQVVIVSNVQIISLKRSYPKLIQNSLSFTKQQISFCEFVNKIYLIRGYYDSSKIKTIKRKWQRERAIYMVPTSDFHESEYVGVHFKESL